MTAFRAILRTRPHPMRPTASLRLDAMWQASVAADVEVPIGPRGVGVGGSCHHRVMADIEVMAVAHIKQLLAECDRVRSFIDDRDKTPLTDGHIDLYATPAAANKDHVGRVDVQVKGQLCDEFPSTGAPRRISRTDLKALQGIGGVLYLVVLRHKITRERRAYFQILDPFTIAYYLGHAPARQKTITVPLRAFPEDVTAVEEILSMASAMKRHDPATGFDSRLLGDGSEFKLRTLGKLDLSKPVDLTRANSIFMLEVVTPEGMSVALDGELRITPPNYVSHPFDATLTAGGVTYQAMSKRALDPSTVEITVAPGLILTIRNDPDSDQLNITAQLHPPATLAERLKAVNFFIELNEHGQLELNGEGVANRVVSMSRAADIESLVVHRDVLARVMELCTHLGIDPSLLDIDALSGEPLATLDRLHELLVLKREHEDPAGHPGRVAVEVGDWMVMLVIVPGSDASHWVCFSPFNPNPPVPIRWSVRDASGQEVPVTVYDITEEDPLVRILNLRLDSIADAYAELPLEVTLLRFATLTILRLISVADATPQRRHEFLAGALQLAEWVLASAASLERADQTFAYRVNRWQILHRLGRMTGHELAAVRDLRREVRGLGIASELAVEAACCVLLGDATELEYTLRDMTDDQVEEFKGWPIWTLALGSAQQVIDSADE